MLLLNPLVPPKKVIKVGSTKYVGSRERRGRHGLF